MHGTRALLQERGLGEYWRAQDKCRGLDKEVWKGGVRLHVDEHHDGVREGHQIPMLAQYNRVKNWDPTPAWRAHTRKEIDRRGALVMERYLDDKMERMGKTLLTQCRMGCLPVMRRVAEEERLSAGWGGCLLCRGHIESQDHLLLQCREEWWRGFEHRMYDIAKERIIFSFSNTFKGPRSTNDTAQTSL